MELLTNAGGRHLVLRDHLSSRADAGRVHSRTGPFPRRALVRGRRQGLLHRLWPGNLWLLRQARHALALCVDPARRLRQVHGRRKCRLQALAGGARAHDARGAQELVPRQARLAARGRRRGWADRQFPAGHRASTRPQHGRRHPRDAGLRRDGRGAACPAARPASRPGDKIVAIDGTRCRKLRRSAAHRGAQRGPGTDLHGRARRRETLDLKVMPDMRRGARHRSGARSSAG